MFKRHYQDLDKFIDPHKVNIIYGPRQVGKSTLLLNYLKQLQTVKYLYKSGDELDLHQLFSELTIAGFDTLVGDLDLLVIDEAQLVPNIGRGLKLIHDHYTNLQIIVTGSASFDLVNKIGEPLTGRDNILYLYPLAFLELSQNFPRFELMGMLETLLLFGSYPESMSIVGYTGKVEYLEKLVNSYLLKDVLALEQVKGSKVILDLLRLIAFQIGQEVSMSELGSQLGLDKNTVARYLDLLEKAFVLVNIRGFSRNLRKEVTKNSRYYFWDNGIRNALIRNFNPLNLRNDVGMLWENYLVIERLKKQAYLKQKANNYFWRTYDRKEIDWVEEREGKLSGFEFKCGTKIAKAPKDWLETYNNSSFEVINKENYVQFLT